MTNAASTTCGKCQRVVYVTDVDGKGMCCFCGETKKKPAAEIK
jgi:hypothetical protein